jgi:signal transduction histidine kinase
MDEIKNFRKEKYFWFLQVMAVVVAAGLAVFNFVYLGALAKNAYVFRISLTINIFLIFILALRTWIISRIFSDSKKVMDSLGTETEKKTSEIQEFEKITRQLVRRDLELARANQRLAELDVAKSDFVSVAAHQLRTPLTGIKWSYAALLDPKTGPLNKDQEKLLKDGLAAITNTVDLINDLLNVAHVEEGKYKFDFKRQPLQPIAQQAIDGLKMVADEKKITLSSKIPSSGLPDLNLDGEKMGLALTNLVDNAIKYTPEGGRIDFMVSQEKGLVKIVVQDSGIGIPKSQKGRLFTKFFRAENAVGVQTSGTGLGLYMVKSVIERHGGKVTVDSAEGKGSTFMITLPEQAAKKSGSEDSA